MTSFTLFQCFCDVVKIHRLIFDGGSSGNYQVELCSNCYGNQDKKFLVKEEYITEIDDQERPKSIPVMDVINSG